MNVAAAFPGASEPFDASARRPAAALGHPGLRGTRTSCPSQSAERAGWIGAAIGEWCWFLLLLGVASGLLVATTVLPQRAKTERMEARERDLTARVAELRAGVDLARREIDGLAADPWCVERELRLRTDLIAPGEYVLRDDEDLPR